MNSRSLKILEFDKVLNKISNFAINDDTKNLLLNLKPTNKKELIESMQLNLTEVVDLILSYGNIPIYQVKNIIPLVERSQKDAILSTGELLLIGELIQAVQSLKDYFREIDKNNIPNIKKYFESLSYLKNLGELINKTIIAENEIADNASQKLLTIRKEKNIKNSRIKSSLNRIINNSNNEKYLQDKIVSVKNGRYVVPVKSEYKNKIPGTVVERSSSGSTVFIEPLNVLELNNEINELEIEEKKEINRILRNLSQEVKFYNEELKLNYTNLIDLDFLTAKANYALKTDSHPVEISNDFIELKKARHPLIDQDKVVPLNYKINPLTKSVVITGPNTGGKTVSLKTFGLLSLMFQSGLFLPVKEGSKIRVFDDIFADIGDEQSIEQNLSTFSSHLTNIIEILKQNNGNSLILFDELGAGTDPIEGSGLAISIIDHLKNTTNLTLSTTHYPEIKEYALNENEVENASVEFDVNSLKPTYRLIMGIPGKSNAFEIAKRLGFPEELIRDSKSRIEQKHLELNDSIDQVQEELLKVRQEKEKAEKYRIEAQNLKFELQQKEEKFNRQKEKIIRDTTREARQILEQTKKSSDILYKEIQKIQSSANSSVNNKHLEELRRSFKSLDKKLDNYSETIQETTDKKQYKLEDFKKGDRVRLINLGQEADVLKILQKEKKIEVISGQIRLKVKPSDLQLLSQKEEKPKVSYNISKTSMNTRLDLRGKSVAEAQILIEEFIADATLLGKNKLEVIHGFGTGQLRKTVHDYLKKSNLVSSYRLGGPGEGGAGATIIEL